MPTILVRVDCNYLRERLATHFDTKVVQLAWATFARYVIDIHQARHTADTTTYWDYVHDHYMHLVEHQGFPELIDQHTETGPNPVKIYFKLLELLYNDYLSGLRHILETVDLQASVRSLQWAKLDTRYGAHIDLLFNVQHLITQDTSHDTNYYHSL